MIRWKLWFVEIPALIIFFAFPRFRQHKGESHEFEMTLIEALSKLIGFVENACFPKKPNVKRLLGTPHSRRPLGFHILVGGGRIIGIFPVKSSSKMPAFSWVFRGLGPNRRSNTSLDNSTVLQRWSSLPGTFCECFFVEQKTIFYYQDSPPPKSCQVYV